MKELDTKNPQASAVGTRELNLFFLKTVMTCSDVLLFERRKVQSIVFFATSALIYWDMFRFVPYYHAWVNLLQGCLSGISLWCSAMLLIKMYWVGDDGVTVITAVLLVGIPLAGLVGAVVIWARLKMLDGTRMIARHTNPGFVFCARLPRFPPEMATQAIPSPGPTETEEEEFVVVENFANERHVEVSLRFIKNIRSEDFAVPAGAPPPHHILCPPRPTLCPGTALLQAAVSQFPDSALVHLIYADFIIAYFPTEKERAQVTNTGDGCG